jgi:pimeloyl-ACP methyl ester carboxylesterase
VSEATTHTIVAPGATLVYDVRENPASDQPPLLFMGSPMGASGFGDLAGHFTDRTVVTYDPRGSERSKKDDPASVTGPAGHAADVHRVIQAVGGGPMDVFASSGGAINALALVAAYPGDVRTVVVHEPPIASSLPDGEHAAAAVRAVHETYERSGWGAGMAHFIAVTGHRGPITAEVVAQPAPDPQMFGMPAADDGTRTDPLLGPSMIAMTAFQPDWEALRAGSKRIVPAAGQTSAGTMANRGAYLVGERLGAAVVVFPGGHAGFLNSEWEPSDVDAFAARLREALAAA